MALYTREAPSVPAHLLPSCQTLGQSCIINEATDPTLGEIANSIQPRY